MRGFTLVEALIAVLVLGLVVTASLKLVMLSERGLAQVRVKEDLLDEANRYMVELAVDPTNDFGVSGDVSWEVEERSMNELLDSALVLEGLKLFSEQSVSVDIEKLVEREYRWREMELKKGDESIRLFLPFSELAAASGDLTASGDSRSGQ
ncbi:MAG: prepilin-type N-terminal cleavage/methylation domain-containing protein [Synergistaceae bacterium]|jgi:prepilin-type N-terminal cleavage/methylation domain-containing protein|nr:prepilin-type N-terminal cleavage/methylation domain-containing protein [Synergistaceae bacterium]